LKDEDGIKIPYIVTIDEGSQKVLSIYRNYDEEDPLKKKNTILCTLQIFTWFRILRFWFNTHAWWSYLEQPPQL
jgi:hypothetical protein